MRFPILVYIFLGLFAVASIVQLYFAFIENQKWRQREKFLCMFSLGLACVFAFPTEPMIYIGAFLGMIGDILVLRKKTFYGGVVAFLIGHLCYFAECYYLIVGSKNLSFFDHMIAWVSFFVVMLAMFLVCRKAKKHSFLDKIGQSLYFGMLAVYIPVFIVAIVKVGSYLFLGLIGGLLFIASDSILVYTHFGQKFKRYDFYIMMTYLIAEFLIISSFTLTLLN